MLKKMYDFQIPKQYIFVGIGTIIATLTIVLFGNLFYENLFPKKLTIAAGKRDGEVYKISQAIAKVVGDKTNIKINVCETDGTDDNLRAIKGNPLEGTKKGCDSQRIGIRFDLCSRKRGEALIIREDRE